jgi:hypothetical protein
VQRLFGREQRECDPFRAEGARQLAQNRIRHFQKSGIRLFGFGDLLAAGLCVVPGPIDGRSQAIANVCDFQRGLMSPF